MSHVITLAILATIAIMALGSLFVAYVAVRRWRWLRRRP